MKRNLTINDIAKALNISKSTVSRALRDSSDINQETALLNANVEGIIISVSRDTEKNEHIRKLKRKGVPLVLFNRVIENFKAAKVVVNDYYGAFNMVDYLIKTGCRRIAHISGPNNILLSNNRKEGYFDALKNSGIERDEKMLVEGDFTIESGIICTKKLLVENDKIDAIFAVCDAVAFGAMKVLKEKGIKIPDEISVAGFTNELMAELVEPALTTVKQPIYEIGETASKLLFAQLNDPDLPAELCVLDTELEIRESTKKL